MWRSESKPGVWFGFVVFSKVFLGFSGVSHVFLWGLLVFSVVFRVYS